MATSRRPAKKPIAPGWSKRDIEQCRALAAIPESVFDDYLEAMSRELEAGGLGEVTEEGLLRFARAGKFQECKGEQ